ncbi:TDP-N-acetylfucosamine:lipid II N-acetylfucosaminyltransferase [Chitinophaga sp. Mgbs1]|uniref:TDP-N-acetylfucosamine:lipid II N-acetylfucosaminyltransferase n=1 Tax=Chitinophaga solisilvae TaxID=1233460 RepID=A0A3S1CZZ6_9BACT|nr:TDP-N-acetylfucosamine:lipid II N-acetylfucosaminyltransferase [Chitinophaga solisilvae]
MNYHLMVDDKFINDFISDAEKAAPGNNIYIIDGLQENARHVKNPLAVFAPYHTSAFRELTKNMTGSDKVFIHWTSESAISFVLSLPAEIIVSMFFWGGDIVEIPFTRFKQVVYGPKSLQYFEKYEERAMVEWNLLKPVRTYKTFRNRYIRYPKEQRKIAKRRERFFKRLNYFFNWSEIDFEWIRKHFQTDAAFGFFFYNFNPKPEPDTFRSGGAQGSTGITTILLGNSDTASNNHQEALEVLAKFRHEPIKLIIPLNYGDRRYGDMIEQQAISIFGKDKVQAIRGFMNREDYYRQLDEVDIAFMFHYRTQAAGNTLALLYRGKKVFLHHNSTVYQFLKEKQIHVWDAATAADMSFEEFSRPIQSAAAAENVSRTDAIFDISRKMQVLQEILS